MIKRLIILLTLLAMQLPAQAGERLLMTRTTQNFPEAMLRLQEVLTAIPSAGCSGWTLV